MESPSVFPFPNSLTQFEDKEFPIQTAALNTMTSLILKPDCKQQHITKDWKKTKDLKNRNITIEFCTVQI